MAQSGMKPQAELHEPLPFERLLAEFSTFFINLPADEIDNEIDAVQSRICELLDLDRSTLWITSERLKTPSVASANASGWICVRSGSGRPMPRDCSR